MIDLSEIERAIDHANNRSSVPMLAEGVMRPLLAEVRRLGAEVTELERFKKRAATVVSGFREDLRTLTTKCNILAGALGALLAQIDDSRDDEDFRASPGFWDAHDAAEVALKEVTK